MTKMTNYLSLIVSLIQGSNISVFRVEVPYVNSSHILHSWKRHAVGHNILVRVVKWYHESILMHKREYKRMPSQHSYHQSHHPHEKCFHRREQPTQGFNRAPMLTHANLHNKFNAAMKSFFGVFSATTDVVSDFLFYFFLLCSFY